jgi:D-3-phosphoglycerate dehydrogenase
LDKPRIAVTATDDFPVAMPVVREVLRDLGEIFTVAMPYRPLSPEETRHFTDVFRDVDAVLLRPGLFTRPILEAAGRLKIIAVHGAGVDQVDVQAASECGIVVANAPGANADAVAELTLGLILSLLRRIPDAVYQVRFDGRWGEARPLGRELRGKVVGLVGVGAVGRRVAVLASAFGAKVVAYDPYIGTGPARPDVEIVDLRSLLGAADIVSLHVPLTAETLGIMGTENLRLLKRGALIVNTSRGGIVDETALMEALETGQVAGAALDVIEDESAESRARFFQRVGRGNVIVTPHMGGSTVECLDRVARVAVEEIARCLRGEEIRYAVNAASLRPR